MKSGLGDRNNQPRKEPGPPRPIKVSMKSGLGDRNNLDCGRSAGASGSVSMKSGLGDRNNPPTFSVLKTPNCLSQ